MLQSDAGIYSSKISTRHKVLQPERVGGWGQHLSILLIHYVWPKQRQKEHSMLNGKKKKKKEEQRVDVQD